MATRHIKVHELLDFIESDEFIKGSVIPISRLRAISQFHNPSADPNDTALILSIDTNGEIIGYIGILPCCIYRNGQKQKIYSNTGWWVHPEKGRKAAMTLFYSMLEICGDALFFTDLTPHTTEILKATSLFEFSEPVKGIKVFLKFSFHTYLTRKVSFLTRCKPILKLTDDFLNIISLPFSKLQIKKYPLNPPKRGTLALLFDAFARIFNRSSQVPQMEDLGGITTSQSRFKIQRVEFVDDESAGFIDSLSKNTVVFRKQVELNWILNYPWLQISDQEKDDESAKYYFSLITKEFTNYCYKIFRDNVLIGFVFLTSREGEFKLPYYFCSIEDEDCIFSMIVNLLYQLKAKSFITWQTAFLKFVNNHPRFYLFKKEVMKQEAYSKGLSGSSHSKFKLQDGDSDMVFT